MTDDIIGTSIVFMPDSPHYAIIQVTEDLPGNTLPDNCVGIIRASQATAASLALHLNPPTVDTAPSIPMATDTDTTPPEEGN